jgi:hypothetical protein
LTIGEFAAKEPAQFTGDVRAATASGQNRVVEPSE